MKAKKVGEVILTAVLATVTASVTFLGLAAFKNRFFPNFGNPKIEVDAIAPIERRVKELTNSPEKIEAAKEAMKGFAKGFSAGYSGVNLESEAQ